jgi:leucyl aminopeptidase
VINLKDSTASFGLAAASEQSTMHVASAPPEGAVLGVPVGDRGDVPPELGVDRAMLQEVGFDGQVGQAQVVPRRGASTAVAVGVGNTADLDASKLRDAAAALARAASKHPHLAVALNGMTAVPPEAASQAVVEGALLARYRYDELRRERSGTPLREFTFVADAGATERLTAGAERGRVFAEATILTRDLANAPPAYLTATRIAEVATAVARERGLGIDVYDKDALIELGCGGLLGVNAGSTEPPRMIKLTYRPTGSNGQTSARGHLALVGKGIMYDSGGISLKPSDAVHATMKQDMSGAAAILGAMSALQELDCRTAVTGYLMCTDNMPSGSATKLGDVLTIRGGTTVEVMNTDAEGRLVMADALVLAAEEKPDAIVDIATLTGACLRALGPRMAGVFGNNQNMIDQVSAAAGTTDEPVWQLPLERNYRKELDSDVADMKNMGGPNGGAIHAALFLEEFVDGLPWAHLDIAGPVLVDADESWRPKGASGFGARLLLELALNFSPPNH